MNAPPKETLLFVDDEESITDIACTYFSARGYQVLTAADGRQGLELIGRHRIDCCFTDINMPGMDGLELADHIRARDNTIPVIIMTGYPSLDNTIQTVKNGVVDILVKPVNLHQMELCLQRVLRERRLFIKNLMLSKELEGKAKLEKLNTELLHKVEELNVLNRILTDFAALHESNAVFNQLVEMAVETVHADAACFFLSDENDLHPLPIAAAESSHAPGRAAEPLPAGLRGRMTQQDARLHALIKLAIEERHPLIVAGNNGGGQILPDGFLSLMLVPLSIRTKILGVLVAAVGRGERRFNQKDLYYLDFMIKKASSGIENLALYENIYNNLLSTLYAFVQALEARDPYTKEHSSRVTQLAMSLARAIGCTAEEQEILNVAGMLHDVGKIGIRDEILLKPGRLEPGEYRIIQQHPVIGYDIMGHLGLWTREKQIVRHHHERFDGQGYPDRIAGQEIPRLARILSVADVYDALASDRAYRGRLAEQKILAMISSGSGTQFDPAIVEIFRQLHAAGQLPIQPGAERASMRKVFPQ